MANQQVGITVFIKDKMSKTVKSLAKGAGGIAKGMKAVGASIVVANQAAELLSKGFNAVKGVLAGAVQSAIELRSESDPLVNKFRGIQTAVQSVGATLGSSVMAAMVAVGGALKPVISGAKKFLEANRGLIATKIVQYLFKMAGALTEGLAQAALVSTQLWTGLQNAIFGGLAMIAESLSGKLGKVLGVQETAIALGEHFTATVKENKDEQEKFEKSIEKVKSRLLEMINAGYGPAMKAAKALSEAMGDTPVETTAQGISKISSRVAALVPQFEKAAKAISEGMGFKEGKLAFEEVERKIDRINRQMKFASTATLPGIEKEFKALFKSLQLPVDFNINTNNLEMGKEQIKLLADGLEAFVLDEKEAFNLLNDGFEQQITMTKMFGEALAGLPAAFATLGASIGSAMAKVAEGTLAVGDAYKMIARESLIMILDFTEKVILAFAAQGAAAAFAGNAGAPGIGAIIGAIAGATVLALIKGYISALPSPEGMARGGYVTGGVPNRDSVPAMLMPGEYVMSKPEVSAAKGGGGGGTQNVNLTFQSDQLPDRVDTKRWIRQVFNPSMKELKTQGIG
tara:strand:+ start:13141 stop:14853 length:1713 start_codon:yes stop_codon:yes gene_type:complete